MTSISMMVNLSLVLLIIGMDMINRASICQVSLLTLCILIGYSYIYINTIRMGFPLYILRVVTGKNFQLIMYSSPRIVYLS